MSSSTRVTRSTSPTRRSRCSNTSAGSTPPTCCRRWWRRPPRRPAARNGARGGSPMTSPGCSTQPTAALPERLATAHDGFDHQAGVSKLAWTILSDDPTEVVAAVDEAISSGATPEECARAVAYAAALRITRFHTQNDHGDWDEVHHSFTAANAVHQAIRRAPTAELLRAVYHGALRVYLDRFLNVPAARLPGALPERPRPSTSPTSQDCWDREGRRRRSGRDRLPLPGRRRRSRRRPSPRSGTRCSPRTPSSTGSRPTRPPSASSMPGRRDPRRAR